MEWKCHVCGDKRPDEDISVHITDVSHRYGMERGLVQQNVRFCNDRPSCVKGAKDVDFIGGEE